MTPVDMILGLVVFIGILAFGVAFLDLVLTTPAHIDARRRNRAGDRW